MKTVKIFLLTCLIFLNINLLSNFEEFNNDYYEFFLNKKKEEIYNKFILDEELKREEQNEKYQEILNSLNRCLILSRLDNSIMSNKLEEKNIILKYIQEEHKDENLLYDEKSLSDIKTSIQDINLDIKRNKYKERCLRQELNRIKGNQYF